jgi:hypothetical protein
VVSEKMFTNHGRKLKAFISNKMFELLVVDEAHGIGKLRDGIESGLYTKVTGLVKKLLKLQVLLISSDPGWTTKNEKLYGDAMGLTGSHKLENRVVQRHISKFNMPKIETSWFPRIEVSRSELDRIQTALRRTDPRKKNPNLQELALSLPFDLMAQHLGDHVDGSTEHEQWAIWAVKEKEKLRDYLERRDIKCSPIYRDKGGTSPETFARKIMEDASLQVIFPPESHERGINLYRDIKNCVFWDESEPQWMTEDRRSQIKARHARRNTCNKQVTVWRFKVAPDHPYAVNLTEWTRCKAIADGPRANLREMRDKTVAAAKAAVAAAAATGGAAASASTAAATSPAVKGKRKRKRSTRGGAADSDPAADVSDPAAASPPSGENPEKRKRSTPEADESMAQFLSRLGLEKCASQVEDLGIETPADFVDFTETELVDEHGFKLGHVRKIYRHL